MIHVAYTPPAPLATFVDFFWAADEYVARAPRERVLPSGSNALVIVLGSRPVHIYDSEAASAPIAVSGAILCGTRQTPLASRLERCGRDPRLVGDAGSQLAAQAHEAHSHGGGALHQVVSELGAGFFQDVAPHQQIEGVAIYLAADPRQ